MIPRLRKLHRLLRRWLAPWLLWRGTFTLEKNVHLNVPVRIDGQGEVNIGEHVSLGYPPAPRLGSGEILLQARGKDARITIGARSQFSNNVSIVARACIQLGKDCLVGDGVMIVDSDFHEVNPERRREAGGLSPVYIGNNVWIGSRAIILKGVHIGDHSVIAAGSVVTSDIPPRSLAGGVPARVLKRI